MKSYNVKSQTLKSISVHYKLEKSLVYLLFIPNLKLNSCFLFLLVAFYQC